MRLTTLYDQEYQKPRPEAGDIFELELDDHTVIETTIAEVDELGNVAVYLDETAVNMIQLGGMVCEASLADMRAFFNKDAPNAQPKVYSSAEDYQQQRDEQRKSQDQKDYMKYLMALYNKNPEKMNAKQKMVLLAYLRAHPWPNPRPKRIGEDAPALVRGAAGLAVGAVAAAGTVPLMGIFGPVFGIGLGALGTYNASHMAMQGADAIWDWATKKFGGEDNAEHFAMAHLVAAGKGASSFEYRGKEYAVTVKPAQLKQAISAVKQVAESRLKEAHGPISTDQVKKVFTKNGKPIGEIGIDPESSPGNGPWYVKHYASGYDVVGFDDAEEATEELKTFIAQGAELDEAKYHGRDVSLGKPVRGGPKKFYVYVRDPSTGNVKKVNFGDPNMRIKKSSPKHRKSFRARHHCATPGPRNKANYWSCRKW